MGTERCSRVRDALERVYSIGQATPYLALTGLDHWILKDHEKPKAMGNDSPSPCHPFRHDDGIILYA
jgi:hypothetical protein